MYITSFNEVKVLVDNHRLYTLNFSTREIYREDYLPTNYPFLGRIVSATKFYVVSHNYQKSFYTNWNPSYQSLSNYYQSFILTSDQNEACYKITSAHVLHSSLNTHSSMFVIVSNPYSDISTSSIFETDTTSALTDIDQSKLYKIDWCYEQVSMTSSQTTATNSYINNVDQTVAITPFTTSPCTLTYKYTIDYYSSSLLSSYISIDESTGLITSKINVPPSNYHIDVKGELPNKQ